MQDKQQLYMDDARQSRRLHRRVKAILPLCSLLVILSIFWWLKLTGITLAGEAFCGQAEHTHSESCAAGCSIAEHIHTEQCYSDITADVESAADWEATLTDLPPTITLSQRLIEVARSQLGYTESTANFFVDADRLRHGYTRYGQWYGNPYGDWSAMFVSFCLHYSDNTGLPLSAGPETMRINWQEVDRYRDADAWIPRPGDLVFLDTNGSRTANSVAIITEVSDQSITVIEGNVNDQVVQTGYSLTGDSILGYGLTVPAASDFIATLADEYYVWLDGTCGNLSAFGGSENTCFTVLNGESIILPETWTSPAKYHYRVQGWYDVKNCKYYAPGSTVPVSENLVFYADWVAYTYDIGQFNAQVSDTESTNEFITTRLYDYNFLFNVLSTRATVNVSRTGHSESWSLVQSGNVPYGQETLNYIFLDWGNGGTLSYPSGLNSANTSGGVHSGLYTPELGEILFGTDNAFDPETGTGIPGKTYLGTGDHLFQLMTDPSSKYYGYYYYDSALHAAAYNQSEQRFYVYDYLERCSDSAYASGSLRYSDFLPLNSPYANTNGKNIPTYTYAGDLGEYEGVNHLTYDAKYNSNGSSTNNVAANLWFGISFEMKFFLSGYPGEKDADGEYLNKDIYGKEMLFEFSGDDDLWVLVDGEVVLDVGGIHGVEGGSVNFSSGVVTVNGTQTDTIEHITSGEHVMTIYYLERGGSQTNCAMFFNVVPRYALELRKEDVLTQEALDGAEFSFYDDPACTIPSELWISEDSYHRNEPAVNTFRVENGTAKLWGLGSGKTYYIRETHPPDAENYSRPNGIICLKLDKRGIDSSTVEIMDENGLSPGYGFTVYDFRIEEETKKAYITVTNAQDWVSETTTVQVMKQWDDAKDHSSDAVTVYLTVTDPDGTVRRIRYISLCEENQWNYIWTNIPKYAADQVTLIHYGIEESYSSGYQGSVQAVDSINIQTSKWAEALTIQANKVYLLKTANGCLASTSATAQTFQWVDEEAAVNSPLALWNATVSGSNIKFINGAGQVLSFNYGSWGSNRYFLPTTGSASTQTLVSVDAGSGLRFYSRYGSRNYYVGSLSNGRLSATTSANSGMIFTPMTLVTQSTPVEIEDYGFLITNTPLKEETSMSVTKQWDVGTTGDHTLYERLQVTIRLLANGKDTGQTVTLNLKNGWKDTFLGLPYKDENGNVIVYTVEESWENDDWLPTISEVTVLPGEPPNYAVTVTNVYRWGHGYELPSTGGYGPTPWVIAGFLLATLSLITAYALRRRQERRNR